MVHLVIVPVPVYRPDGKVGGSISIYDRLIDCFSIIPESMRNLTKTYSNFSNFLDKIGPK